MKKPTLLGVALTALLCAAPLSLQWSAAKAPSLSVDAANARLGRPLTPMTVAGVNRRVHRRAYYGAGAVAAGAAAYGTAGVHISTQAFALVRTRLQVPRLAPSSLARPFDAPGGDQLSR